MKMRKLLAAATALTLLLGIAATPEVGSEIKLALTAHAESGEIPIDEAHFPDEVFRERIKQFDTDENGSFSAAEIAEVTEISCSYSDAASLTGIEYFTELTKLDCAYNHLLTSLDVSKNTKLESLWCKNNQFTSLDLHNNTALESLQCGGNDLTSLDLSACTELMSLGCEENQLTSLDLSNNAGLYSIYCPYNQLTSLDVSKNTALIGLSCNYNQLTSLDVSNNTGLSNLDCSNNQISTLDISNNPYFISAYIAGDAETTQNTINYSISDGYIDRSLNIDSNSKVITGVNMNTKVNIDKNNFPDDQFRAYISENVDSDHDNVLDIREIERVVSIYIDGALDDHDIYSLKGIEYFNLLTSINIRGKNLTELDVSNFAFLISLNCSNNQLTELDVSQNTSLTGLNCGYNQLTELDVSKNTALKELNCGGNNLTSLDVSKNNALEQLLCADNKLNKLDTSKNPKLNYLNVSSNQLTDIDVLSNTKIQNFYCNMNLLTEIDISKNTELKYLGCSFNKLTSLDVSNNPALLYLSCCYNELTTLDVSKNPALYDLDCSDNQISSIDISKNPRLILTYTKGEERSGVYYLFDNDDLCKLEFDKTTKIFTGVEPEVIEVGTADVTGLENIPDVDITDMGITFEDESGETYTAEVQSDGTIMLPALPAGEYTVTASLENCPSRDYEVTVEAGKPVELDVELKLYGDVNGDGDLSSADLSQINEHVQEIRYLKEEYDIKVADVSGDGKVTSADLSKINEHVQQLKFMWQQKGSKV